MRIEQTGLGLSSKEVKYLAKRLIKGAVIYDQRKGQIGWSVVEEVSCLLLKTDKNKQVCEIIFSQPVRVYRDGQYRTISAGKKMFVHRTGLK